MKLLVCLSAAVLMLAACAAPLRTTDTYSYFDQHCREHARDMVGEVDEEGRYRECMKLHGYYYVPETDEHLMSGAH